MTSIARLPKKGFKLDCFEMKYFKIQTNRATIIRLHTRNVFQALGKDLQTPSKGLVGYAKTDKKGNPMGGTATAINLALKHDIPVRNLYKEEDRKFIEGFVGRNK